jgi:hypothetical protein
LDEIDEILKNHERRILALEKALKKEPKKTPSGKKSTEDMLVELKTGGFFSEEKTIAQIMEALHARGRIVRMTDLPSYLLRLVRNGSLNRERKLIGKRRTWVYFA